MRKRYVIPVIIHPLHDLYKPPGFVGQIPVFDSYEAAVDFCKGDKELIVKIQNLNLVPVVKVRWEE